MTEPTPIEITERELVAMTDELDERHHETMPAMYEAVAEWTERRHEDGLMIARKLPDSAVPMSLLADHPNVQFNYYRKGIGTCEIEMH